MTRYQRRSSALTAMADWVRAAACSVPARNPRHCGQLQFHCGNPPPAPEPRTPDPHVVPLFPLTGTGGIAGTGKKTGFSQKMGKPVKRTPLERSYSETRMYMLTFGVHSHFREFRFFPRHEATSLFDPRHATRWPRACPDVTPAAGAPSDPAACSRFSGHYAEI